MNIALLDDESFENENLYKLITEYAFEKDYDICCKAFTSGRDLLMEDKFDLYFLDFLMDGLNGIDVAKALKAKFNNAVTICYLTSYEKAAAEVINQHIYADGFLQKPVTKQELHQKLDAFYASSFFRRLELKKGGSYKTVYSQDIVYVEAKGKKSIVYFYDGAEEFNYLISELETDYLPKEMFCRIHRSFIINMLHVDSYDSKKVRLKNGIELPIKIKDFRQIYREYAFMASAE